MNTAFRLAFALSISSLAFFAGGCATIVKGTTQAIPVSSTPSGADVKIDGNKVGQTPLSVDVKRKSDHVMTIEKSGFQSENIAIIRGIGGAVFGNAIAGGLIGWGVDAISGAQWNLLPHSVNVTLKTIADGVTSAPVSQSGAAVFIDELRKLDEMHVAKTVTDEEYAKMRTALVEKYSK